MNCASRYPLKASVAVTGGCLTVTYCQHNGLNLIGKSSEAHLMKVCFTVIIKSVQRCLSCIVLILYADVLALCRLYY